MEIPYNQSESHPCEGLSEGCRMSGISMAIDNHKLDKHSNRTWKLVAGWLLFALGVIGIVLPVLPTTIFWIGAVWFWSRSSPHLTERILSHPRFGRPVLLFMERGEIARQGKLMATGGMALGFFLLQLVAKPAWPTSLSVGLILIIVATWLWFRPEPTDEASIPLADAESSPPLPIAGEASVKAEAGTSSE